MLSGMNDESATTPNRGRKARRPASIPLRGWLDIAYRVVIRVVPDQFGLIAAGVAFYMLLAIFPAIAALMALAGLFTDPASVVVQLQNFTRLLPDQAALILLNQAQLVAGTSDEGLSLTLWLGVGFSLYLSTRATTSLIHGLNVAYEEREKRSFVRFWLAVILLTAALLFGGVLLVLLLVGLPTLLAFLPLDFETERLLKGLRWAVMAIVLMVGLAGLYRWGPSRRRARWRWLSPGVVIAAALWFAGSLAFTLYVANFANYNQSFGSLGGVIVLLTWLWLSAFIVLLGALLDAEIEAQTMKDSTIGPDRPMGERGAVKADILGKARGDDPG
jgi:membrane protein